MKDDAPAPWSGADNQETQTAYWGLLGHPNTDIPRLQNAVDRVLTGYQFYPEVEWCIRGYRPPEGHEVFGGWRHPQNAVFVFLLDNPHVIAAPTTKHFLIHAAGLTSAIQVVDGSVRRLKKEFEVSSRADSSEAGRIKRLKDAETLTSARRLMVLLALFGGLINLLTRYLKDVQVPKSLSANQVTLYFDFVYLVHAASLVLLLTIMAIALVYALKYGLLLIRQL
jgi:hypothetical protein